MVANVEFLSLDGKHCMSTLANNVCSNSVMFFGSIAIFLFLIFVLGCLISTLVKKDFSQGTVSSNEASPNKDKAAVELFLCHSRFARLRLDIPTFVDENIRFPSLILLVKNIV